MFVFVESSWVCAYVEPFPLAMVYICVQCWFRFHSIGYGVMHHVAMTVMKNVSGAVCGMRQMTVKVARAKCALIVLCIHSSNDSMTSTELPLPSSIPTHVLDALSVDALLPICVACGTQYPRPVSQCGFSIDKSNQTR